MIHTDGTPTIASRTTPFDAKSESKRRHYAEQRAHVRAVLDARRAPRKVRHA